MEHDKCLLDRKMLQDIHTAVVGSVDGKQKGMLERINTLEAFKASFQKWFGFIIGTAITNVMLLVAQLFILYVGKGN